MTEQIDKAKLRNWLYDEMYSQSDSPYVTAIKWVVYQLEKGTFDVTEVRYDSQ